MTVIHSCYKIVTERLVTYLSCFSIPQTAGALYQKIFSFNLSMIQDHAYCRALSEILSALRLMQNFTECISDKARVGNTLSQQP